MLATDKKEKIQCHITFICPFYDGLMFHRVIKGFMMQGGCPNAQGNGDAGYWFADEINAKALGLDKQMGITNDRPHSWIGVRTQMEWQQRVLVPILKSMGISPSDVNAQKSRQDEIRKKITSMSLLELYRIQGYKFSTTLPSKPPKRGVLAMANSGPNTNGSQFFINFQDTPWLTGKHTVFGRVISGMEIVDKIAQSKVGPGSKPLQPIKIISIRSAK